MSDFIMDYEYDFLDALTPSLRQVSYSIFNKVQSPPPMIVTAIFSALSAAFQGVINVEKHYGGEQPAGVFTMVVADSGERKTTTDSLVMKPIIEYVALKSKELDGQRIDREIELITWQAQLDKKKGLLKKASTQENADQVELLSSELKDLYKRKPVDVTLTDAVLNDVTPAALLQALEGERKGITLHSSDAGNLLSRSNMDFIVNVNLLWDGQETIVISRKTTGESVIKSGRLTLSLMLQPAVLERISKRKEDLLRSSGCFARMLITRPESMQGHRLHAQYIKEDESCIEEFQQRLTQRLKESQHYRDASEVLTLKLSHEARSEFYQFYHKVEEELCEDGEFADINDAASKAVDNATRIAALLHIYDHGFEVTEIERGVAQAACNIAHNYLYEFKKAFAEKTVEELEAEYGERLLDWLRYKGTRPREEVYVSYMMQYAPNSLRDKKKLQMAIYYLARQDLVIDYSHERPAYVVYLGPRIQV